ncbi:MAG: hypothetical protein RI932_1861 [Pseudomonadota bacterium]
MSLKIGIAFEVPSGRFNLPRLRAAVLFEIAVKAVLTVLILPSLEARASDFEVIKQKSCTILLKPAQGLSKGQVLKAQSSSGKSVTLRVVKLSGGKAQARLIPRGGKCAQVSGQTLSIGAIADKAKKFNLGIKANAGYFTFRQPFLPFDPDVEPGSEDQKKQEIVGLSGLAFSGGLLARYSFNKKIGLELGASVLSTKISGKSTLVGGDEYLVEANFMEAVVHPALVFPQCLTSRLFCKLGGVVGFPIKATISTKSTVTNESAPVKYLRLGGEAAAGVNLGTSVTLLGGAQIGNDSGSYKFESLPEAQNFKVLTVYIYGGLVAVF